MLRSSPAVPAALRWDPLTQEIFNFVRSRGVATFTQIDTHLRNNYKHLISSELAGCCMVMLLVRN